MSAAVFIGWGGLVAASALLGLIFNAAVARQAEARGREERLRDIHRALCAGIAAQANNPESHAALDAAREEMLRRIAGGHVPLILREPASGIFAEMRKDIHILPRSTIDPVVNFSRQLDAIRALIEDIRGDTFRTHASAEQRAAICAGLIAMRKTAPDFAEASPDPIGTSAEWGMWRGGAATRRARRTSLAAGPRAGPARRRDRGARCLRHGT